MSSHIRVSLALLACGWLCVASACNGLDLNPPTSLKASGLITAEEVSVAAEVSGRIAEVLVEEGDPVTAGQVVIRLDDEWLRIQHTQASAAVDSAQAAVDLAAAQLDSARLQYELAVQGARLQDKLQRTTAWSTTTVLTEVSDYSLPPWYFGRQEIISATLAEISAAQTALATEQANLDKELQNAGNADFVALERRLAAAQARYQAAYAAVAQAQTAITAAPLSAAALKELDAATYELKAARLEYDHKLSTTGAEAILNARARVAAAQAQLDNAQDALAQLQTGDYSLQVTAAQKGITVAERALAQAQAGLAQAQAAQAALQLQWDKTAVKAPVSGVVLARNADVGEMVGAGTPLLVVGQLEQVKLTVYVPEDRYGAIQLGQKVSLR